MSADAVIYPKLLKIYEELNRRNAIFFDAGWEHKELELERASLKGLSKQKKKGDLHI